MNRKKTIFKGLFDTNFISVLSKIVSEKKTFSFEMNHTADKFFLGTRYLVCEIKHDFVFPQ